LVFQVLNLSKDESFYFPQPQEPPVFAAQLEQPHAFLELHEAEQPPLQFPELQDCPD